METLSFKTAFKYPFNRPIGMLNILWVLVPIFGWFALGGYGVVIIRGFLRGEFKELPLFDFTPHMKLGFDLFVKYLPFVIAYAIVVGVLDRMDSAIVSFAIFLVQVFILPIMVVHYINKGTVASSFEFRVARAVFDNLGDYLIALFKTILLSLVFVVMYVVLVGFPANAFTNNIFLTDFYRRNVKEGEDDMVVVPIVEEKA